MKETKIMILGGGENQLPLIKMALELGYYTIVCDMRSGLEGINLADLHLPINYMEKETVLEKAKAHQIDGIISNSEPAMLTVAYVAEHMGLPGNTVRSVEKLISKDGFRQLQHEIGVYSPMHYANVSLAELKKVAKDMRYPIVVKPSESSGSRGTTRMDAYQEDLLEKAFLECEGFSRNHCVSVEEYVEMPKPSIIGADVFVLGEETLWYGLYRQDRSPAAPMIPMNEIFPMELSPEEEKIYRDTVRKTLKGAGISHGEYNVEAYFTKDHQLFVIEINPRQGGNNIPRLIYETCGVSFDKLLVTSCVGDDSYFKSVKTAQLDRHYVTQQVVFAREDGRYNGVHIAEEVVPYVQWIHEEYQTGDIISRGNNAEDALAYVCLKFDSKQLQEKYTNEIESYVYPNLLL